MPLPFALGLDGGGTGCRARLADAAGRVLAEAEAGPANIVTDPEGARANLMAAATAAMAGHAAPAETAAVLGLAGANIPAAAARLAAGLPFARARIETDLATAATGALGGEDGLLALIGTGSAFARAQGGRITPLGGWGLVLGDEASGAWIGRALCARALHATDGRVPHSPLLRALLEDHGGPHGLVGFAATARPADFAALAPRVLQGDDPAAAATRAAALAEIRAALAALQTDPPLPVVFAGGLGPALADAAPPGWLAPWPMRPARGTPLDGALALARALAAG